MTVSHGAHKGQKVEIVDIELDKPRYSDQRQIMTAVGIALDKAHHLSGGVPKTGDSGMSAEAVVEVVRNVIEAIAKSDEQREITTAAAITRLRSVK